MQLSFPIQLCIAASPITQTHITGAVQKFLKKLRRKGKTVPQRSEPKAPRFKSGWILFMQDILSSQPAACRKGKRSCIAQRQTTPMSEQADKLGRQNTQSEKEQATAKGLFPLSLEVEDKPEQPLQWKRRLTVFWGYFFSLYTVVLHVLWFWVILGEFFRAWSLWLHLCSSRHWLDLVTR